MRRRQPVEPGGGIEGKQCRQCVAEAGGIDGRDAGLAGQKRTEPVVERFRQGFVGQIRQISLAVVAQVTDAGAQAQLVPGPGQAANPAPMRFANQGAGDRFRIRSIVCFTSSSTEP